MRTWQQQIPDRFAVMTAPSAMHPNDEKRAMEMQAKGVAWSEAEAEAEIRAYLIKQQVTSEEMTKQMLRAEEKLRSWLDG